jgi:lipid A 3-O-deacylase
MKPARPRTPLLAALLSGMLALAARAQAVPATVDYAAPATAPAKISGTTFSFISENDLFAFNGPTDRAYTNGIRLEQMFGDDDTPRWTDDITRRLCRKDDRNDCNAQTGWALGQNMYTPNNISKPGPILDNRPYAGWLYGAFLYRLRNDRRVHQFELDVGAIGPLSLAGQTQSALHRLMHLNEPQGWGNQLRNEPGVVLSYRQTIRVTPKGFPFDARHFDILPTIGAGIGNVFTYASAGVKVRMGFNLPDEFSNALTPSRIGIASMTPSPDMFPAGERKRSILNRRFDFFLIGGFEQRYVYRNITLDGNTFTTSQSVNKKRFVHDTELGASLRIDKVRFTYRQVSRSAEYDEDNHSHNYGSLLVSYYYNWPVF